MIESFIAAILAAFVGLVGTFMFKSISMLNNRIDECVTHREMQEYMSDKIEGIKLMLDLIKKEICSLQETINKITEIKIKD